jgi:CHAT domain-containing protein/tetratricopeptide (TPR) repeat protein
LANKGNALQSQGKLAEAIPAYEEAIGTLRRLVHSNARNELAEHFAAALVNEGVALQKQGRLAEAASAHDEAIAALRRLVHSEGRTELANGLAAALMNKGIALQILGRLAEAVSAHEGAICILRLLVQDSRPELADGLAAALVNKGNALGCLGKLTESVPAYEEAIGIVRRLVEEGRSDLIDGLALVLMNKGNALRELGKLADAVSAYEEAVGIRRRLLEEGRAEFADGLAAALTNKGSALRGQGKLADALLAYEEGIGIARRLVEKDGRSELANDLASSVLNKALALLADRKPEESTVLFEQLSPALFRADDLGIFHHARAELLWEFGQREQALDELTRGRDVLCQARRTAGIDETTLEYIAQREGFLSLCVSRALELDHPLDAFAAVQDGKAAVFGDLRSRLRSPVENESTEVVQNRAELVHCLRHPPRRPQPDLPPDPTQLAEWFHQLDRRTEAYLRAWRIAGPRDRPAAEPETPTSGQPVALVDIQRALPPHWALLDFWRTGAADFTGFLLSGDGLSVHPLPFPFASNADLRRNLDDLRRMMANPFLANPNDEGLDDLHAFLFAPLHLADRGIRGLYLVPHGFLHALPLHAARNGDHYLCDEFDIAYLPSTSLLPQLPPVQPRGPILSLANPERGTEHCLPFSDWEGWQIEQRHAVQGSNFHRGRNATPETTRTWTNAALLHFSCHGMGYPSFAPLSHLRLADDLLLAHDVVYRRPPLREGALVVLNGCQTAVRDDRAFNESMGLMTAFLLRGASLVLATQWSVVDGCAANMVLAFLEQLLHRNLPPTEALKAARAEARQLTVDDLLHRWEEVEEVLDEAARDEKDAKVDKGKFLTHKAWLCRQAGREGEALQLAEQADPLLRAGGLEGPADRLLAVMRGTGGLDPRDIRLRSFDHPVFWGAFQLVGRVT